MTSNYIYDPITKVHSRPGSKAFTYTDGEEVEIRLLNAIERSKDLSAASSELANEIVDWPSEYHLSSKRHNLLRPFNIGREHIVLELGCGCGAMTRHLGETGATVIAVEGSKRRAQIAASRCRDLPNVSIYCDNLIDFLCEEKFDFVTLIGVLEYAPKFIKSNDPVESCLVHAGSFIKKDGALILAIENQLGMKYFNGCVEDHVGIPYYGINGLYCTTDPVTFGRYVLSEKLSKAGFSTQEFFYPFPDYKLPGLILSEACLSEDRLNIADLLIHNTGRDNPETHHRAFAEDLTWREAIDNQLLPALANSFLVMARPTKSILPKTDWLAKMFNQGQRHFCYQVESSIEVDENARLRVRKRKAFPEAQATDDWLRHVIQDNTYLTGNLLIGKIHKTMAREAGLDELATCFIPWLEFLLTHVRLNGKGQQLLPGDFVDCVPANLIELPTGKLQYFDAEWVSMEPIPIAWVVVRGITYSLINCLENRSLGNVTYRQFISDVAQRSGILLFDSDFTAADEHEIRMVAQCHVNARKMPRLADFLDKPLFLKFRLSSHVPELRQKLAWHEAELARVKGTLSWRITAPMRVVFNLYQKLINKFTQRNDGSN